MPGHNRRASRRVLLQALYSWELGGCSEDELIEFLSQEGELDRVDRNFLDNCLHGVLYDVERLDNIYKPFLDRSPSELTHVERACLRAGTYELVEQFEIPFKVVISEWVALAKLFGAQDGYRYINAVLDAVAHECRGLVK